MFLQKIPNKKSLVIKALMVVGILAQGLTSLQAHNHFFSNVSEKNICTTSSENLTASSSVFATSLVTISVTWNARAGQNKVEVYDSGDNLLYTVCKPSGCYDGSNGNYISGTLTIGCLTNGSGYYVKLYDTHGNGWNGSNPNVTVTSGGATVVSNNGSTANTSGVNVGFTVSGGGGICGGDPQNYSYESTPGTNFTSVCPSTTSITYNVTDDFDITDLNVGLNVTMGYRHHLTATITSPAGTEVELTSYSTYGSGSASISNWDVLFDDASSNPLNDGNSDDTASPHYENDRTVNPSGDLSDFFGENSVGTWTLKVCDYNTSYGNGGTVNRFKLDFEGIPGCVISDAGLVVSSCDDSGTLGDSSDDTFSFSVNPTGNLLGSTYSVSGDVTASGISYGSAYTFDNGGSGFLISGSDLTITITDDATGSCVLSNITVAAPAYCSNCNLVAPTPQKN